MATFSNIGLQEPSTITNRVAAVTITRGSTAEQQEILVLGDAESSIGLARVVAATPDSTMYGLVVRQVGAHAVSQASTVWEVQSAQSGAWTVRATLSSTGADNPVAQSGAWTVRANMSSTAADNPVTVSGYSTIVSIGAGTITTVSSLAGIVAVRPSDTSWASSAGFHFDSSGALNIAGTFSASTTVNVSSVSGVVNVQQNSTVWQVQVGGYSTIVSIGAGTITTVSSLAGIVAVRPSDTNWASSAGFHFDSSGALNIAGTFSASTTVNVSSVSGVVNVQQNSTVWQVQVGGYSTIVSIGAGTITTVSSVAGIVLTQLSDRDFSTNVVAVLGAAPASTTYGVVVRQVGFVAASTTMQVSSVAGVVNVQQNSTVWQVQVGGYSTIVSVAALPAGMLSTSAPATGDTGLFVRQIGFVAYSTTVTLGAGNSSVIITSGVITTVSSVAGVVNVAQNSTVWQVQVGGYSTIVAVSSIGGIVLSQLSDRDNSTKVAAVLGGAPASTTYGLVVREVNYSTIVSIGSGNSSVIVTSGTITTVTTVATVTTVSSLAGVVKVQQNSTVWAVQAAAFDGLGNALESSTSAPSSGARGLVVRQVIGPMLSYAASTTGQSSLTTIVSSQAASKAFVYALSITSTLAGPVYWGFYDGVTLKWTGVLAAPSSAISGVNLAVSPPAYLFSASTGAALSFNVETSNAGLRVSAAYWVST